MGFGGLHLFKELRPKNRKIPLRTPAATRVPEIFLSRIDTLGPKLECFVTVTAKRAFAEADAADALLRGGVHLGPLHGLPYGLKDIA
jgi:Asp-tRNA(Asn)/Glu-tRNA(Gln) amidotransferase A subunit family amidase